MGDAPMHVVIVGCGRVGSTLAMTLQGLGHTVTVVDRRAAAFKRLPDGFDGQTVVGIGFDRDHLKEAGIERAGALAAVTNGDNSNIVVARVAKELFQVPRVVARIYDPRRAAVYERLGVSTVATVAWTTDQALRRLLPHAAASDWTHSSGRVHLVERLLPDACAGQLLNALEEPGRFRLAVVNRLGVAQVPGPDIVAQEGDILHFIVDADALDDLERRLADGPMRSH